MRFSAWVLTLQSAPATNTAWGSPRCPFQKDVVHLTPTQQAIVAKTCAGWTLYERVGLRGHCWLVRNAMTETVSAASVRALAKRKVIGAEQEAYPRCRYRLVNHGKELWGATN